MPDQVRHDQVGFCSQVSFSDRPALSTGKKVGCLLIGLIEIMVIGCLMLVAALGDCAPNVDGSGCENDELWKTLMFPGSFIFALVFNFIFIRWLMRNR
jgi:hypothetical protein